MCLFSQFFAKNVITATKLEHFETDPMFAMTIQSNLCIFRYDFFPVEPYVLQSTVPGFYSKKIARLFKKYQKRM